MDLAIAGSRLRYVGLPEDHRSLELLKRWFNRYHSDGPESEACRNGVRVLSGPFQRLPHRLLRCFACVFSAEPNSGYLVRSSTDGEVDQPSDPFDLRRPDLHLGEHEESTPVWPEAESRGLNPIASADERLKLLDQRSNTPGILIHRTLCRLADGLHGENDDSEIWLECYTPDASYRELDL